MEISEPPNNPRGGAPLPFSPKSTSPHCLPTPLNIKRSSFKIKWSKETRRKSLHKREWWMPRLGPDSQPTVDDNYLFTRGRYQTKMVALPRRLKLFFFFSISFKLSCHKSQLTLKYTYYKTTQLIKYIIKLTQVENSEVFLVWGGLWSWSFNSFTFQNLNLGSHIAKRVCTCGCVYILFF